MPLLNELANGTKNGYSNKPMGQAAAWSLRVPANKPVSPESAIMADHGGHHGPDGWESIIGTDERELVDPRDIVDGGRYRCELHRSEGKGLELTHSRSHRQDPVLFRRSSY